MNKEQSSILVMSLAIIAATMLISTVMVETRDLFDDTEAEKKEEKTKKWKKNSGQHPP